MPEFLQVALGTFAKTWAVAPGLLLAAVGAIVGGALLPAGLALTARGLVNASVTAFVSEAPSIAPIVPWLVLGFVLTTAEGLVALALRLLSRRLADEVEAHVTTEVLVKAAQRDLAYLDDPKSQDELARVRRHPGEQLSMFVVDTLTAAGTLMQAVSLLGVLVFIEPLILVVAGVAVVPYLFFQSALAARQYAVDFARATRQRWSQYFVSTLTEAASAGEVKMLRLGEPMVDRFRALMVEFGNENRPLYAKSFRGGSVFVVVTTVAIYALFVRVAYLVVVGQLTLGDLAIFGGAATRLRNTLETGVATVSTLFGRALRLRDIERFLGAPVDETPSVTVAPAAKGSPTVVFEDVSFAYPGASESVLRGLSFRIEAGENVAVVGRNGAGKTTLVKLLAGLYEPSAGRILFRGVDLRSLHREALYEQIGFVFQDSMRFEADAADNIAYGDWRNLRRDRSGVEAIARAAGVEALVRALPYGFDTKLGRSFGEVELSGGQWQQIAIARTFARDRSLLILDEPSSQLDPRAERELFSRFRAQGRTRDRTTVIVSHRPSTVQRADRVLVLDGGRLVESGTHGELMAKGGAYAQLYEIDG